MLTLSNQSSQKIKIVIPESEERISVHGHPYRSPKFQTHRAKFQTIEQKLRAQKSVKKQSKEKTERENITSQITHRLPDLALEVVSSSPAYHQKAHKTTTRNSALGYMVCGVTVRRESAGVSDIATFYRNEVDVGPISGADSNAQGPE